MAFAVVGERFGTLVFSDALDAARPAPVLHGYLVRVDRLALQSRRMDYE